MRPAGVPLMAAPEPGASGAATVYYLATGVVSPGALGVMEVLALDKEAPPAAAFYGMKSFCPMACEA